MHDGMTVYFGDVSRIVLWLRCVIESVAALDGWVCEVKEAP